MASPSARVDIHYLRPPDDEQVFIQWLVLDRDDVKVTLAQNLDFASPVVIHDRVVLEAGSDAVWFTFPGRWHDIGRFHRKDRTFTGVYANILTPPRIEKVDGGRGAEIWTTTDLFLDVWLPPEGGFFVLDADQLEDAVRDAHVSPERADRAWEEVRRLRDAHHAGRWPPDVVGEWDLERARKEFGRM